MIKRAIAMTLAIALIGSVLFAGSAAAFEIDTEFEQEQDQELETRG